MPSPTIRLCTIDDAEPLLSLWDVADAAPSITQNLTDLRVALANPAMTALVAIIDERVIGSVFGGFDGWRAFIYRLAVHPDFRRQGIARQLVTELEQRLRARGARRITALVETDRPAAAAFWNSIGYRHDQHIARFSRNLS